MKRSKLKIITFCSLIGIFGVTTLLQAEQVKQPKPLRLSLFHPINGHLKSVQESEHRAIPVRKYWLDDFNLSSDTKAYLLNPVGKEDKIRLQKAQSSWSVSFKTPWGEGPQHGVHNVYVVNKKVVGDTLYVRTAQWLTIHHSCAWGHDHKYNDRQNPKSLVLAPLEIVPPKFWDGNFHVQTKSGDKLKLKILQYGKPLPNASVKVTTAEDWNKELRTGQDGTANIQIIRDYYPKGWENFHRRQLGSLLFTAEYEEEKAGEHAGKNYQKIKYITTLPWKYGPAQEDYNSYSYGLAFGGVSFLFSIIGVLFYRERRKETL